MMKLPLLNKDKEEKVIIKEVSCPDNGKGISYNVEIKISKSYNMDKRDKEGWCLIWDWFSLSKYVSIF